MPLGAHGLPLGAHSFAREMRNKLIRNLTMPDGVYEMPDIFSGSEAKKVCRRRAGRCKQMRRVEGG